jgi:hypothetical protein
MQMQGRGGMWKQANGKLYIVRSIETSLILRCLYSEFPHSQKGSELLLAIVRAWLKAYQFVTVALPRATSTIMNSR